MAARRCSARWLAPRRSNVREEDHELLSTIAGGCGGPWNRVPGSLSRDGLQASVTGGMAIAVVELLEEVDVEQETDSGTSSAAHFDAILPSLGRRSAGGCPTR